MCSGWFDRTETFLSTALKGKQGVQGAYALVRGGSSTSNLIEPTRTTITELARCVEVSHMSSGWFDCTEPSLSTSLQGKQGVQGAHAIVRGGSRTANLIEPTRNHIITEIARFREVCHRRSGWFDFTEPSLRTSLQGKQGVPGAYAIVQGGSSTSNLLDPTRTTTSQR